jgi:hypothetical protein
LVRLQDQEPKLLQRGLHAGSHAASGALLHWLGAALILRCEAPTGELYERPKGEPRELD